MIPKHKTIHPDFKFNSVSYTIKDLTDYAKELKKDEESFKNSIGDFLLEWLNEKDSLEIQTSGSTGAPKIITIKKEAMVNSALATGNYFELTPKEKALLCLPANYIAGKMMLVRAIVLGLELDIVNPSSNLELNKNKFYRFCAMIPIQLQNSFNYINNFDTIILGGAPVSKELKQLVEDVSCNLFETYGMTETVTHIAIKKLNNLTPYEVEYGSNFEVLPNIEIYQDHRDCLVIDAPLIAEEIVLTNDIVKLHSKTEFKWLGRIDNVINTGGVKVFPEQIEKKLHKAIKNRFFIISTPDDFLGEKVLLIIESDTEEFDELVLNILEKFEKPKNVYFTPKFIETISGKLQRNQTLELVLNEEEQD